MVRTPGAASISTSSASPATSSNGLARRIPLELPILTSFARTTTTPARRAHIVVTLAPSAHPLLWLTLPLSGTQGAWGGAADGRWWPAHSRGWLASHFDYRDLNEDGASSISARSSSSRVRPESAIAPTVNAPHASRASSATPFGPTATTGFEFAKVSWRKN